VGGETGWRRRGVVRLLLGVAVAGVLFSGAVLQTAPTRAETATVQPTYTGDCGLLPTGWLCLEFVDGYLWAVEDAITGWGMNHGTVQMAYGLKANYVHALGTEMIWVLPK